MLYAASALFAGGTTLVSSIPIYQQWGRLAVGPYVAGALLSAWLAHRARAADAALGPPGRASGSSGTPGPSGHDLSEVPPGEPSRGSRRKKWQGSSPGEAGSHAGSAAPLEIATLGGAHWTRGRIAVFVLVLCGATLMPLSLEVLWQAGSGGTSHAQPEVLVVEQAGQRVLHGKGLYQQVGKSSKPDAPPGQPAYDAFFPYLPGMAVFGLPSGTHASPRLTDARVVFSLITILAVIAALAMCRGPAGPRVLTLQAMTVLPTAALPLATGGDDLPVVAFMLLGLVLLERRRPVMSGLALGAAASLKFTAWPLAALSLLVARDANEKRALGRLAAGMAAVVGPAVLPVALRNPKSFIENVVRFPLGLTGVHSPAASSLPGHLFVSAFPALHRPYTVVVALVGLVVVLAALKRRPPSSAADVASFVGWTALAAILLAPATRVGYLLYPIDMLAWAWLLSSEARVREVHSPLEAWYTSSEKGVDEEPDELDESGGGREELPGKAVGSLTTATSQ